MSATVEGRVGWSASRDAEGHRTYTLTSRVRTTSTSDGPQIVLAAPTLPVIGSMWLVGNDVDAWAFCTPEARITMDQQRNGEPGYYWLVEQTFSTRPIARCQDISVENPLLEPQRISGSFVKFTKETGLGYATTAAAAIGGERTHELTTVSFEPLRGIEVDENRPTVRIEQNVNYLGLATIADMVDTVNDATLWGLPARTIKLSNVSWERKFYGHCAYYYTRVLEFEINYDTFDWQVPSYGALAMPGDWTNMDTNPTWTADGTGTPTNAKHYVQFKDWLENPRRTHHNSNGAPVASSTEAAKIDVIYYSESNFLLLGVQTELTGIAYGI